MRDARPSDRTSVPSDAARRGYDAVFTPKHRTVPERNAEPFVLGYVGRLSIEKNVALLPLIQRELTAAGISVRFLIVGHGVDEDALRQRAS